MTADIRSPYTAEQEARILETLAPTHTSPAELFESLTEGVTYYRNLRDPTLPSHAESEDVKKRLAQIARTSAKLFRLLSLSEEEDVSITLDVWTKLEPSEDESNWYMDLRRNLMVLAIRAAAAEGEPGEPGRPRHRLRLLVDLLVAHWAAEHGRPKYWNKEERTYDPARGNASEYSIVGPVADFVRACTEPLLTPEDQRAVERHVLKSVLARYAKSSL